MNHRKQQPMDSNNKLKRLINCSSDITIIGKNPPDFYLFFPHIVCVRVSLCAVGLILELIPDSISGTHQNSFTSHTLSTSQPMLPPVIERQHVVGAGDWVRVEDRVFWVVRRVCAVRREYKIRRGVHCKDNIHRD